MNDGILGVGGVGVVAVVVGFHHGCLLLMYWLNCSMAYLLPCCIVVGFVVDSVDVPVGDVAHNLKLVLIPT